MPNVRIVPELQTPEVMLLEFQIPHYTERLLDARAKQRSIGEIAFLRKSLYDLKKQYQSILN